MFPPHPHDDLAEWLRRWPAKPLGYAREGSNPSVVAIFTPAQWSRGAMDSAPDFESGGWGFESLRDRFAITISAIGLVVKYLVANEVPRVRFPDGAFLLSWRSWQRVGLIIPRSPVRPRSKAFCCKQARGLGDLKQNGGSGGIRTHARRTDSNLSRAP